MIDGRPAVAGEVLVKYRRPLAASRRAQLLQDTEADQDIGLGSAGARRLRSRRHDTATLLNYLRSQPDVAYAEPNYIVRADAPPNDPWFHQLWGCSTTNGEIVGGQAITCAAGTHGFNAITNACDPADDNGHGTHVAGAIGAVGNDNLGVTGVNWTTSIMAAKSLGPDGTGSIADAIDAIDFVIRPLPPPRLRSASSRTAGAVPGSRRRCSIR